MSLTLRTVRAGLRLLPPPLRERAAVRLFMLQTRHDEPEREQLRREQGEEILVAGHHATAFGHGPVALLMHGWEGRGLQLAAYIEPLVARGHRVIALDGPNHGRNRDGVGALPTFAALLEKAIEELDPHLIVAHSLGASAAILAANRTGYDGAIICLGGPPETHAIFTRARNMMGLPESGRQRFLAYLAAFFPHHRTDDVHDIEASARACRAKLFGVLAREDAEVPVQESRTIIEAGGGRVAVVDCTHRSVLWEQEAVDAAVAWLERT